MVCTVFFNFVFLISFNKSAKIIVIGKLHTRELILILKVFRTILPK